MPDYEDNETYYSEHDGGLKWSEARLSFQDMRQDMQDAKKAIERLNLKLVILAATVLAGNQGLNLLVAHFSR